MVEILEVTPAALDRTRLWGRYIDVPKPGAHGELYAVSIVGWALGRSSPAVAVELVQDGRVAHKVPIHEPRPDVAERYPAVEGSSTCGFALATGVLGAPLELELLLLAVLEDGARVEIGTIRTRRRPLRSGFQPRLQPLMVTSQGRTGSSWLMQLLAEHPEIVVDRPFPYENRLSGYWLHMLKVLSEPANRFQSTHPDRLTRSRHWVGSNPFYSGALRPDQPDASTWLGREHVERLAAFCQESTEAYYARVAEVQGQVRAAYFAEKQRADYLPWLTWELYPRAREVLLVRDFRDVICSILAFNARRGFAAFGRDRVGSDEEFVRRVGQGSRRLLEDWQQRSPRVHLLRYEDLVQRPRGALQALLTYLGLDAAPETIGGMLERAAGVSPELLLAHRTSSEPGASIGRWQSDLDPALWGVCREALDEVLQAFGYGPTPC